MNNWIPFIMSIICFVSCSQNNQENRSLQTEQEKYIETELVNYFKYENFSERNISKDSLYYTEFEDSNFVLSIHDTLSDFIVEHTTIQNPFYNKKYELSEHERTRIKNYPKSYSVIYSNHIISLLENGRLACFNLINYDRNLDFESKINTKKFDYHWLINGKLTTQVGDSFFIWEDAQWIKLEKEYPFKNKPILFSDEEFIVFSDCFGEWGGSIYFYEIQTEKVYYENSTCANTVWKTINGYQVLSNLTHGGGSTNIMQIPDPTKLYEIAADKIGVSNNYQIVDSTLQSRFTTKTLDIYGGLLYARFGYYRDDIFLGEVENLFFLCKITNNNLRIIYPFFREDFFSHDPITQKYGDYYLMNRTFYGKGLNREVGFLLFKDNRLQSISWNE